MAANIERARELAIAERDEARAELQDQEPKVSFYDAFMDGGEAMTPMDAGNLLRDRGASTGARLIFPTLRDFGWVHCRGGRWKATARAIELGYMDTKLSPYVNPRTGVEEYGVQPLVAPKGLRRLALHFGLVLPDYLTEDTSPDGCLRALPPPFKTLLRAPPR